MKVRALDPVEWPECKPWYNYRGDELPFDDLVPLKSGFIVEDHKGKIGVGFLILTNSKTAIMEFLMTNHERSNLDQAKAVTKLALHIEATAKALGFTVIMGFTPEDHDSLGKFYYRQGAARATKLMRLFYKKL